jgi:hypothetical protein
MTFIFFAVLLFDPPDHATEYEIFAFPYFNVTTVH